MQNNNIHSPQGKVTKGLVANAAQRNQDRASATAVPVSSKPARSDNPFKWLWTAGYTRLIPIVPPGGVISPTSSLARRPKDVGKMPGELGPNGWTGLPDWQTRVATEADLDRWHFMGAGVGLLTGYGVVALDIDSLDKDLADKCATTATALLGASNNRVGRAPKRAKLYRITEPVPYRRLSFDGGQVELLSEGKQLVVHGVHPVTGRPYEWPHGLPQRDRLPEVTPAQIAAYFEALAKALPAAMHEVSSLSKERGAVEPVQLEGAEASVRSALAALPNDERFGGYAEYQKVAQAIKGALPHDDALGLELFQDWASKWTGGPYEPDAVAKHWKTTKPSHSIGAQYLYALAEKHGGGAFSVAEAWFTAAPAEQSVAPSTLPKVARGEPELDDFDGSLDPKTVPVRQWVIEPRLPLGEVTQCVGEPGIGKSAFALRDALAVACDREDVLRGSDHDGNPISYELLFRGGAVLVYNAEDTLADMRRRLLAAMRHYKLSKKDLKHKITLWSGRTHGALTIMERDGERGPLRRAPGADRLEREISKRGVLFVCLDPQVSLGRGAIENSAEDMNDLLQEISNIADRREANITVIHHSAKSTRDAAGDMGAGRGSFAAVAKARSGYTLTYVRGDRPDEKAWGLAEGERLVRLDMSKTSHSKMTDVPVVFRHHSVPVGNGTGPLRTTANGVFTLSRQEQREADGETAVVVGLVDVKSRMGAAKAAADHKQLAETAVIAGLVNKLMGADNRVKLAAIREALAAELGLAHLSPSSRRDNVNKRVLRTFDEGVAIERDGRSYLLRSERDGATEKATWYVTRAEVSAQ